MSDQFHGELQTIDSKIEHPFRWGFFAGLGAILAWALVSAVVFLIVSVVGIGILSNATDSADPAEQLNQFCQDNPDDFACAE